MKVYLAWRLWRFSVVDTLRCFTSHPFVVKLVNPLTLYTFTLTSLSATPFLCLSKKMYYQQYCACMSLTTIHIILPGKVDCQGLRPPALRSEGERRKEGREEQRRQITVYCCPLPPTLYRCMLRKFWQRGRWVSAHVRYTVVPALILPTYPSSYTHTCTD